MQNKPFDHLASAQLEAERLVAIVACERSQPRRLETNRDRRLKSRGRREGRRGRGGIRTGIELHARRGQSASVVHGQLVALLRLALALDGVGDFDLEVLGGDEANGARGQGGEEQGCLHGGELWEMVRELENEANEAREEEACGRLRRKGEKREEKRC